VTVAGHWPGCHGIRVDGGCKLGTGPTRGAPLARVRVRHVAGGQLAPGDAGTELWRRVATTPVGPAGGIATVEQRLWRAASGRLLVRTDRGAALAYDPGTGVLEVDATAPATAAQLLAGIGLPLVLHDVGVLVVHAAACARDGRAVVLCGASGRGKSSLLVALVDAGWEAISEDVCAIAVRDGLAEVWPGPPWVRLGHGQRGPRGTKACFTTVDKVAWDLAARRAQAPVAVDQVVLLEEPGGDRAWMQAVDRAALVRELAPHTVWLADPAQRAARLFPLVVALSRCVRSTRLRLPRSPSWLDHVPAVFA